MYFFEKNIRHVSDITLTEFISSSKGVLGNPVGFLFHWDRKGFSRFLLPI